MANENKRRFIDVEDYSAATTTDVIPNGQVRWFNKVTGYNAAEIIELVGDGSTTIASLARRQWLTDTAQTLYGIKTFDDIPVLPATAPTSANQAANKAYVDAQAAQTFDVIDTDSGDVAATTPSSPSNGDKWIVVNSGSSGNYVTGLPGSIKLGDGKRCDFIYDSTNTTWRYEDVIVEETQLTSEMLVIKWADGRQKLIDVWSNNGASRNISSAAFTSIKLPSVSVEGNVSGAAVGHIPSAAYSTTAYTVKTFVSTSAAVINTTNVIVTIEGRWKA